MMAGNLRERRVVEQLIINQFHVYIHDSRVDEITRIVSWDWINSSTPPEPGFPVEPHKASMISITPATRRPTVSPAISAVGGEFDAPPHGLFRAP